MLVSIFTIFNDDNDSKINSDVKNINPYISTTLETNLKLDDLIKLTKFHDMKSRSKTQLNSMYDRSSPSVPRSRRVSSVSANRCVILVNKCLNHSNLDFFKMLNCVLLYCFLNV